MALFTPEMNCTRFEVSDCLDNGQTNEEIEDDSNHRVDDGELVHTLAIGQNSKNGFRSDSSGEIDNLISIPPLDIQLASERMPDPDSMKMFVGQIPKDWSEEDCRHLLEPYGAIYTLNILKDKDTHKSKGCCFVTYYTRKSALDVCTDHNVPLSIITSLLQAQNDLHNLKKLPSCRNPIQMKPADNENKNGKLPKFMKEADISTTFANYGIVEECVVLRDSNGQSKGCAFVTFSTRASASSAIRALHQTKTLEGCTSPIVVKFAETSNKEQKRLRNETISPVLHSLCAPQASIQPCITGSSLLDNSYLNLIKAQQQQLMSLTLPQQYITPEMAYSSPILFSGNKLPLISNQILSNSSPTINANKLIASDPLSIASLSTLANFPNSYSALTPIAKLGSTMINSKQLEGPDGANLFIYHLPAEYTDVDLVGLFSPFGSVISAKVFIDKNSNLSKCFGFVSYDNAESAQAAIRSMNGFQVLNKRLKVQLKKVRDRPY